MSGESKLVEMTQQLSLGTDRQSQKEILQQLDWLKCWLGQKDYVRTFASLRPSRDFPPDAVSS